MNNVARTSFLSIALFGALTSAGCGAGAVSPSSQAGAPTASINAASAPACGANVPMGTISQVQTGQEATPSSGC